MNEFLNIITQPFVLRAMLAGVLIAGCAAVLGVVLVLKRYSLIGHGLGDVGFASLSLALAIGINPIYISTPIVIIASFLIMMISQNKKVNGDVAIGMVATGSLSVGVIITALSNGFNIDAYNYMFGSILAMTDNDVIMVVLLSIVVIGLFLLFYNRLFLISADQTFAKALGINVTFYQFLISLLTALTVVIGMKMMGTLLISSLIIFPAVIARKLVRSFKGLVITAGIISVFCFILGMVVSCLFELPTGASIVAVNLVVLLVVSVINKCRTGN